MLKGKAEHCCTDRCDPELAVRDRSRGRAVFGATLIHCEHCVRSLISSRAKGGRIPTAFRSKTRLLNHFDSFLLLAA